MGEQIKKNEYLLQMAPPIDIFNYIEYQYALGKLDEYLYSYEDYNNVTTTLGTNFYRGMFLIDGADLTSPNSDYTVFDYKTHKVLIAVSKTIDSAEKNTINIEGKDITRILGVCF